MSSIAFNEEVAGEIVAVSHCAEKKVGDRVVYYDDFYTILCVSGAGANFNIILQHEKTKKKIVVYGNKIRAIQVVQKKTEKLSVIKKVIKYIKEKL